MQTSIEKFVKLKFEEILSIIFSFKMEKAFLLILLLGGRVCVAKYFDQEAMSSQSLVRKGKGG